MPLLRIVKLYIREGHGTLHATVLTDAYPRGSPPPPQFSGTSFLEREEVHSFECLLGFHIYPHSFKVIILILMMIFSVLGSKEMNKWTDYE